MEPLVQTVLELSRALTDSAEVMLVTVSITIVASLGAMLWSQFAVSATAASDPSAEPPSAPTADAPDPDTVFGALQASQRKAASLATVRLVLRRAILSGLLCTGSLVLIDHFGTRPLVDWALRQMADRSGIQVTYGHLQGGPLAGMLELRQVRAVRTDHPVSTFDVSCSRINVRFSAWDLLRPTSRLIGVRAEQISGNYVRTGLTGLPPTGSDGSPPAAPPGTRNIIVGQLEIVDAALNYTDNTVEGPPVAIGVVVRKLDCAPFRTALAPYDLIFRSRAEGTLDEQPFRIQSGITSTGERTEWQATGLPVQLARAYVGGPFRWLADGTLDFRLVQIVDPDPDLPVKLNGRVALREIRAGVPDNVKPAVAIAAGVLISQMKRLPRSKEFDFELKLDPHKFDLTQIDGRERLWHQVKQAMIAALLQSAGVKLERVTEEGSEQMDRAADVVTDQALKALQRIRERRKAKQEAKEKAREQRE